MYYESRIEVSKSRCADRRVDRHQRLAKRGLGDDHTTGDFLPDWPWDTSTWGYVGYSEPSTISVSGGDTLTCKGAGIGWGSNGTVTVDASTWNATDSENGCQILVGAMGGGALKITNGGIVNGTIGTYNDCWLGYGGGTATLSGNSKWIVGNSLHVGISDSDDPVGLGEGGMGVVNIQSGGTVTTTYVTYIAPAAAVTAP